MHSVSVVSVNIRNLHKWITLLYFETSGPALDALDALDASGKQSALGQSEWALFRTGAISK